LATISAKAAAAISSRPPAASLSRKWRKAERGRPGFSPSCIAGSGLAEPAEEIERNRQEPETQIHPNFSAETETDSRLTGD